MSDTLRIIPLGGLGEVGKNMTVYETGGEVLVVDAGLAFPRDEHLGVDLLLPDVGYLAGKRVRAVILTHGHEDHVGGLPYLLREVEVETVVATRLTLGLIKSKLDEHGLGQAAELVEGDPEGAPLELGPFRVELIRVAHSIPDSVALVIETGAGRVVHTGDWKLDHTPVDGLRTDVGKLAEVGNRGVDLLLGDSTNAERPGSTGSERLVGEAFRTLFPLRTGKILVASFASNIHRMQQAADVAIECGRKVTVIGRSMRKNLNIARNLGYVEIPEHEIISPGEAAQLPRRQGARTLHGKPGRAAFRADADRVRRSSGPLGGTGRHRHHLGEARARETSSASMTRSTSSRAREPRSCTRRSHPCTCRDMRARRSCGRCSPSSARAS